MGRVDYVKRPAHGAAFFAGLREERMEQPLVELSPEITRQDAFAIMDWLKDEEVTRFLSDPRSVSADIQRVVNRVFLPTLTHLFNQGGRFFMVRDAGQRPVGFFRLVGTGPVRELVIVIGERSRWGRRLGTGALRQGLKAAFLDLRAEQLVARIHPDNLRIFRNCGFRPCGQGPALLDFTLERERYLTLCRQFAVAESDIRITRIDSTRLQKLIAAARRREGMDQQALASLAFEVERAIVLPPQQVERDVVTMNSRARLRLNGVAAEVALVYPRRARAAGNVSVFSPVGTAILGFREGDRIDWPEAEGHLSIEIERVLYQPEAAGDFHL
jgi:regulator of nucleoside diphosphate kinase